MRFTLVVAALFSTMAMGAVPDRALSVADRVRAQEAIDRVYYRHQIETTVPFEQAVPREAIEAKVLKSLRLSLALERFWQLRVDGDALQREIERIEHSTKLPDRLREIYRALNDDSVLIREVLARGALAERMARRFHDEDVRAGRSARRDWDRFWIDVEGQLDPADVRTSDAADETTSDRSLACLPDGSFDTSGTAPLCMPASAPGVWTGSFAVYWGSSVQSQNSNAGGRYDPLLDTCTPTSMVNAPTVRHSNSITAAGQVVVVFGGRRNDGGSQIPLGDGGRYDPLLDSWLPVAANSVRYQHAALWTGQQLLIWGGRQEDFFALSAGRLYNPATNVWTNIATSNEPSPRYQPSAVWTGSKMIVWGGGYQPQFSAEIQYNTGGIYDLTTNSWSALSTAGAPPAAKGLEAFWTGSRMFVWYLPGRLFDPVGNTWASASGSGAPPSASFGIWSGREFITFNGPTLYTAYRYDASLNTWSTGQSNSQWPVVRLLWIDTGVLSYGSSPALYVVDNDLDGLTQSCDPCPLDAANDGDGDGHCANVDNCTAVPNRAQYDGDGDGRGDLCDVCPGIADAAQADLDGDGAGDACDCRPADPLIRRPAAVTQLTLSGSSLSWVPVTGANTYSITRGTLAGLMPGQYGGCLAEGITGTTFSHAAVPPSGSGWLYLVRGDSGTCGLGSLGSTSAESGRVNLDPAACEGSP